MNDQIFFERFFINKKSTSLNR